MIPFHVVGFFLFFSRLFLLTFDRGRGRGKLDQGMMSRATASGGKPNLTICITSKAKENSGCAIFKHILALPYGFLGVYRTPPKTEGQ